MRTYNQKKIIFLGSETSLLETLSKKDQTEVVSSAMFLESILPRFTPDLIVLTPGQSITPRKIRKTRGAETIPILITAEDFSQKPDIVLESCKLRNIIICNESILNNEKFINRINSIMDRKKSASGYSTGALVKKAILYINRNYMNPVSRESVAAFLETSPDYLSRIFAKENGTGLWEYLTLFRLSKARDFLIQTTDSAGTIALKCGFETLSYFDHCFKKYYHISPSSLRK